VLREILQRLNEAKRRKKALPGNVGYVQPAEKVAGITSWARIGESKRKKRPKSKSTAYAFAPRPSFGYVSTQVPLGYS
jgi:hypothetical protein